MNWNQPPISPAISSSPPATDVQVTVVLPVYNEKDNIRGVLEETSRVLRQNGISHEIIAVNDGSEDGSAECLDEFVLPELKVIHFRRNFGQTAALMAGFQQARGRVVVSLDSDGQNDPADIPRLLHKLNEGYDVVSGWRKDRKDGAVKRNLPSRVANWMISAIIGAKLHDYGCTLKAYRREVLDGVYLYGEMHRFIPAYAWLNGGRVTEIPVEHHPRKFGQSKYGLERAVKVMFDLLVVVFLHRYAQKPMYLFGTVGLLSFGISGFAGLLAVYYKFFAHKTFVETPLPILFAVMFITGCMCLLMGLLAELLTRTWHESRARTTYVISSIREHGCGADRKDS